MSRVIFRIDTRWQLTSERGAIINAVRNHYGPGPSFTRLCLGIMFSVLKVLSVAIQTRNRAAIQGAIEVSRVQVEGYYQMALGLAEAEVPLPVMVEPTLSIPGGTLPAEADDLDDTPPWDESQAEFEEFVMDD
ncbi:hypothetical protein [Acaryochloris sp. CCMEE 5410]|uniref:hypothetical protein n=1 Tax=Acaryochloris sp. CCMEE 5410 TaxID=310037 RepID=UPI00024837C3|nr:hypothetical protein [Acaryochloris sp. CCMEE 5410]KAI9129608.1 hypothetical protein ON05_033465 [Acaryochloris sp. CCMEE 5410]